MAARNPYDRGALVRKLRGMSDRELRKFFFDLVTNHNVPYPDYLRVVLRATQREIAGRLRTQHCLIGKMRKAMRPRVVKVAA